MFLILSALKYFLFPRMAPCGYITRWYAAVSNWPSLYHSLFYISLTYLLLLYLFLKLMTGSSQRRRNLFGKLCEFTQEEARVMALQQWEPMRSMRKSPGSSGIYRLAALMHYSPGSLISWQRTSFGTFAVIVFLCIPAVYPPFKGHRKTM